MATPGELVATMAIALGIPDATVTQFDRVLAENGLRSKGGRGTSAAKVTARDAANLLIALMAFPVQGASVKNVAGVCKTYGALRMLATSRPKDFRQYGLDCLRALPSEHTFVEGIEALIQECSEGGQFRYKEFGVKGRTVAGARTGADRMFNIRVQGPSPWAGFEVMYAIGEPSTPGIFYVNKATRTEGDMWQTRHVTYRTIRSLASLIERRTRHG